MRVQLNPGTGIAAGALKGVALTASSAGDAAIVAESSAGLGVAATCVDTRDIPGISTAVRGTVQSGFGVLGNNVRGRFTHAGMAEHTLLGIGVDGFSRTAFGVRGMTKQQRHLGRRRHGHRRSRTWHCRHRSVNRHHAGSAPALRDRRAAVCRPVFRQLPGARRLHRHRAQIRRRAASGRHALGSRPAMIATTVIIFGRTRSTAPSITAA